MMDKEKLFHYQADMDVCFVTSQKNRLYFTGFNSSFGYLLISRDRTVLITDFRYAELAEYLNNEGLEVVAGAGADLYGLLTNTLAEMNAKKIGIEETSLTLSQFAAMKRALPDFEYVNAGKAISQMRRIKTKKELELIATAQSITDKAFRKILKFIKPGVTELAIAAELEYQMRKLGADGVAFDTIIASGVNTSKPHANPTEKKVCSGDAVTMDFGAKYHGYCSDMTRTIFVGKPSDEMKNIYQVVLKAQNNAIKNMSAGMTGKQVDSLAREVIQANGYGDRFTHGLGHSVGIDIHEKPMCNEASEEILEENMLMTVEPGIYVPGVGGVRIEDLVILKQDGVKNLTTSAKDIIIL